jgi:hypothetical protein
MKILGLFLLLTACCDGAERCKRAEGDYMQSSVYAETILYQGHRWIHFTSTRSLYSHPFIIIHHPDCECGR